MLPSRRKALAAAALMIMPLLLAAVISYWPGRNTTDEISSVVVLPARVFGALDLAYLTDAVPSTLSTHLAGIQGLETKVPPTSIEFERVGGDYNKIADAYGVNVLVLTAITADAGLFQLNLQVIDPRTRRVIWSNPYQGPRGKYLELIHAAGEGLRRALRPSSSPVRSAAGVASSSEAELAFRQGEHFRDRFNYLRQAGDFDAAFDAFKRALELDPQLADAAAEISRLYVMKLDASGPAPELLSEIDDWAKRALNIDPLCGRAFFTLASAEQWRPQGDFRKRLADGLRGAMFAPQYAPAHTIMSAGLVGSLTLALEATREARKLDPLYLYAPMFEAGNLNQLGRPAEALEMIDQNVLSIEPAMGYALWSKALILIELSRLDEAEELVNRVAAQVSQGRLMPFADSTIRLELAAARKDQTLVEKLAEQVLGTPKAPFEWQLIASLAPTLAKHGQVDAAFRFLQRAGDAGAALPYDMLKLNPRLEALRADPRFQAILARSRARFDEMMQVLNEARARGEMPQYLERPLTGLRAQLGL